MPTRMYCYSFDWFIKIQTYNGLTCVLFLCIFIIYTSVTCITNIDLRWAFTYFELLPGLGH